MEAVPETVPVLIAAVPLHRWRLSAPADIEQSAHSARKRDSKKQRPRILLHLPPVPWLRARLASAGIDPAVLAQALFQRDGSRRRGASSRVHIVGGGKLGQPQRFDDCFSKWNVEAWALH